MNTPELSNQDHSRVVILGATGMIGSATYSALKDSCQLTIVYRSADKLSLLYQRYGQSEDTRAVLFDFNDLRADYLAGFTGKSIGPNLQRLLREIGPVDWVINAMGVTKMVANNDPEATMFLNGAVPHILAAYFGNRLIHITTDCVFDGQEGAPYDEASPKCPVDLYGLSKAIGEPSQALVLRTSTVGLELGTKYGLLEWFLSQAGIVRGFTNHLWNGITTQELGRICRKLATGEVAHPGAGIYHIFAEDITKSDLLAKLRDRYGSTTEIEPQPAAVGVDRRLASRYSFCRQLNLPSLDRMVAELPELKLAQLPTK